MHITLRFDRVKPLKKLDIHVKIHRAQAIKVGNIYAQFICLTFYLQKSKCNFDTTAAEGQVGLNAQDLPVNVATTNPPNKYEELHIYAVAYNGVLKNGWPRGSFIFGATINPAP